MPRQAPASANPPNARAPRRRSLVIAAASAVAVAMAPMLTLMPSIATAASPCGPDHFTASAAADLLKLSALDLGELGTKLDLTIGDTTADMAHARPQHASATADYLSATVAGITIPTSLLHAHAAQDAPPAHPQPDQHSTIALNTAALVLGVGNVSASAGQSGTYTCGAASSAASVANVIVLPGTHGRSLMSLPHNLNGATRTGLMTQHGSLAASAGASAGLAEFDLLTGTPSAIGVKVVTEPTLRGIAGGTVATSSVDYTAPVLDVTLPGNQHVTLDGAHPSLDVTTSTLGSLKLPLVGSLAKSVKLHVRLSIGSLTKTIAQHSISGSAATVRARVSLVVGSGDESAPAGSGSFAAPGVGLGGGSGVGLRGGSGVGLDAGRGSGPGAGSGDAAGGSAVASPTSGGYGPGGYGSDGYGVGYGGGPGGGPGGGYGTSGGATVLDVSLGQLSVYATAPEAVTPSPSTSTSPSAPPTTGTPSTPPATGTPSPSTSGTSGSPTGSPSASPTPPSTLPVTGNDSAWAIGAGVLLLFIGRLVMVLTRRRTVG